MTRSDLLAFLRSQRYAVQTSVAADGSPQAAVVGIAVTADFELIFDTLTSTRKAVNLARDGRIAFVVGPLDAEAAVTVQCEGLVDQPSGAELDRVRDAYFVVFPDGRDRQSLPGITYFRARLTWLRYSDFRTDPPTILEFTGATLRDNI